MSIMMDYVASGIIFGILVITIARIQVSINSTMYENTFSVRVQGNATQLACQLEHDILKAGYGVSSGTAISSADSTSLTFSAAMNNQGTPTTLTYQTGTKSQGTSTQNPDDFPLIRIEGGRQVTQNWGLIYFKFTYYDSAMIHILSTPVTGGNLAKIRAIQASIIIQSPEPVITAVDTSWPAVTWQKVMMPRNLGVIQ